MYSGGRTLTGGVSTYAQPGQPAPFTGATGLGSLSWTNPAVQQSLQQSAAQNQLLSSPQGLSAIINQGAQALANAMGTSKNPFAGPQIIGAYTNGAPVYAPGTAGSGSVGTVVDRGVPTSGTTGGNYYNQPYTSNSLSIGDPFSATPMMQPATMNFGSLPALPAMTPAQVIAGDQHPLTGGAVMSLGAQSLPVQAVSGSVNRGGNAFALRAKENNDRPLQQSSEQQFTPLRRVDSSTMPPALRPMQQPMLGAPMIPRMDNGNQQPIIINQAPNFQKPQAPPPVAAPNNTFYQQAERKDRMSPKERAQLESIRNSGIRHDKLIVNAHDLTKSLNLDANDWDWITEQKDDLQGYDISKEAFERGAGSFAQQIGGGLDRSGKEKVFRGGDPISGKKWVEQDREADNDLFDSNPSRPMFRENQLDRQGFGGDSPSVLPATTPGATQGQDFGGQRASDWQVPGQQDQAQPARQPGFDPSAPPRFNPRNQYDPSVLGKYLESTNYFRPDPPKKMDIWSKVGRSFNAAAEGLNPNIAATHMAQAKARGDLQMKMLEMDAASRNNTADNARSIMQTMMTQSGEDNRHANTQDVEIWKAQLAEKSKGALTKAQGYEMLGNAMKMPVNNQADLLQKQQLLSGASQALGQNFSGMVNQVSTEGSDAVLKHAMELKRDAQMMFKAQNDIDMMPVDNASKVAGFNLQKAQLANEPLNAQAKRLQIAKTSQDLADAQDPMMRDAKRQEVLARSQDMQRRGEQDAFAAIQKKSQMGSTLIGQANQMLANPLARFDGAKVAEANALIEKGQALQSAAYAEYQRPLLRPQTANQPLTDMKTLQSYLLINNMDKKKAQEMAQQDGWKIPSSKASVAGKPLTDMNQVRKYLSIANGNKDQARQLAEADGWTIPQIGNSVVGSR